MKEFLSREGIAYQEKNVERDRQAAQEMVNRTGQMGVPVTVIAGQAIIGFDQPALKAAVVRLRQQKAAVTTTPRLGAAVADALLVTGRQGKPSQPGALLGLVRPGSLAARAGLREGDIITRLNDQPITGPNDLAKILQSLAVQPTANPDLIFWRDGTTLTTRLPLS